MSNENDDPDTLQVLDELNGDWVRSWRRELSKSPSDTNELEFVVVPAEEIKSVQNKPR